MRAKKLFRIILSVVVISVLSVSVFSGCMGGGKINDPGDNYEVNIDFTDEDYEQTATLSVGVTPDAQETEYVNALAKGFNVMFPNVTVTPVKLSGNNYTNAVDNRVQAKNMTDVFFTSENESFHFISKNILLNLKPYINAENTAAGGGASFEDQFVDTAWKIGQKNFDGDQMFLPRSSDRIVTHLNMGFITPALNHWNTNNPDKQLPSDIVKNGWTWSDFIAVCGALRSYYDSQGWTTAQNRYIVDHTFTWAPVLFSLFKSNNASIAEDGKWVFDNAGTRETVEMVREMVEKGYIGAKNKGGANYETKLGAMLFHSSSAIAKYKNFIGDGYNIVTFPTINGESGVTGYGVPGYGIFSGIDEKKRDLAWQFLKYTVSEEGQNILAEAGMCTPPVRQDLSDYNTAKWGEGYRDLNLAATLFESSRNYTESFFTQFDSNKKTALVDAVATFLLDSTAYNSSLTEPSFTVEKLLNECKTTVERELAKI